ncbi:MAG: YhcH/YjgK/YiaL family protein [Opitutales bacterium]
MIADLLSNSDRYARHHPGLAAGFQFLRALPAHAVEGRHEIDGDRVFALVQAYQTGPAAGRKFEFHRKYADIQFLVAGEEVIEFAPLAGLTVDRPYEATKDYGLTADPAICSALVLQPGQFGIFFPEDAHKPGCCSREATAVRKVVVKVLLSVPFPRKL